MKLLQETTGHLKKNLKKKKFLPPYIVFKFEL